MAISTADVWNWYTSTLVFYAKDGWIDRTAHTFRILAALILFPFMLFTMLDITSYIIARTLGAIDETRASTSDRLADHAMEMHTSTEPPISTDAPSILVTQPMHATKGSKKDGEALADGVLPGRDASASAVNAARSQEARLRATAKAPPLSDSDVDGGGPSMSASMSASNSSSHLSASTFTSPRRSAASLPATSTSNPNSNSNLSSHSTHIHGHVPYFFNPHEEHTLTLSGVGVFSPAPSTPGSPVDERRSLSHGSGSQSQPQSQSQSQSQSQLHTPSRSNSSLTSLSSLPTFPASYSTYSTGGKAQAQAQASTTNSTRYRRGRNPYGADADADADAGEPPSSFDGSSSLLQDAEKEKHN